MVEIKLSPFGKVKAIEGQIDEFLDKASEAGMLFEMAIKTFLDSGAVEACEEKLQQINDVEHRCDHLRRTIEEALYTEMLIPDARGDVLALIDDLDSLVDMFTRNTRSVCIERPDFPQEFRKDVLELTSVAVNSVECVVLASRAFFRNPAAVRDHIHKVGFYESESDRIGIHLKRSIFGSDLPLDRKAHLRNFVDLIDRLADQAEDVGDQLSIYTIKRSL